MDLEDFKKRFPEYRYRNLKLIPADKEGEEVQVGGKTVPAIGQDVVVVEQKPISRLAWLLFGGIAAAAGWYAFRRFRPEQPPQQLVIAPPPGAGISDEDKALAEILGED